MSRFGTCRHAHQIQVMYSVPYHPHEKEQRIDQPDEYTCQWLEQYQPLPPPIARRHNGFSLNRNECDACQCYEPAASWPASGDAPR